MKKLVLSLLCLFLLCACAQKKVKPIDLSQKVSLSFFYVTTCPECQSFKENVIPLLEQTFQDDIEIKQYDFDDVKTTDIYNEVVDRLINFDEEYYGMAPFIVVDQAFGVLGFTKGDEQYLIEDIVSFVNGEPLSAELSRRFLFQ